VAESQKRVSRHQGIVAKLASDGRQDSLTARAAGALLESFQNELGAHLLIVTGCASSCEPYREMQSQDG